MGLTTAITNTLCACAQSVSASISSRVPKKFGCCTTSAAQSSPPRARSASSDTLPEARS
jgi:hypothetical protein